jgi:hypothetical protein
MAMFNSQSERRVGLASGTPRGAYVGGLWQEQTCGLSQQPESFGIMVDHLYDHDSIENNHEAFVRDGAIVRSPDVDAQMQRAAGVVFDGDEGRLSEEAFLRDFAGDLPEAKPKVLYAVQQPFDKALLTGKTTNAAWRSKPSYYAVSTEDRTINPDLERFMAKRMGAKTIEVKASHLSLISQPDEITQLILEAAGQRV